MLRSSWAPPTAPDGEQDHTVYRVVDDFGHIGQAWRETDVNATDLETVITDLLDGQYNDPVRVVGFNIAEGWARDVSEDVALELRRRCDLEMIEMPVRLERFMERHREPQLKL